jgi:hypothetical protein
LDRQLCVLRGCCGPFAKPIILNVVILSVGYKAPVAAVERFGFEFDESFLGAIGGHPWEGLVLAENQIIIDAAARGLTAIRYRRLLQQQYQAIRRLNHEPS